MNGARRLLVWTSSEENCHDERNRTRAAREAVRLRAGRSERRSARRSGEGAGGKRRAARGARAAGEDDRAREGGDGRRGVAATVQREPDPGGRARAATADG